MPNKKPMPKSSSSKMKKRPMPKRMNKAYPKTTDGPSKKGEEPGQRRTVARRQRVQQLRQKKNASGLQKGIKANQRKRPY